MFYEGISWEGDVIDIGSSKNVIKRSGAFYSYGDIRLGQGRENAKQFLRDNPKVALEIEAIIRTDDPSEQENNNNKNSPQKND